MILRWLMFANVCTCGHHRQAHLHYRGLSNRAAECVSCTGCFRFRRYWLPRPGWTVWRQ